MEVLKDVDVSSNEKGARVTVMQKAGMLTDMQLRCHNETFLAHKIIVAASSTYLQDVFKYEKYVGTDGLFTILMQDLKPVDLKNILNYIYAGKVRVRSSEVDGFLRAAQLLRIDKILMNKNSLIKSQRKVNGTQAVHMSKSDKKIILKDVTEVTDSKKIVAISGPRSECLVGKPSQQSNKSFCAKNLLRESEKKVSSSGSGFETSTGKPNTLLNSSFYAKNLSRSSRESDKKVVSSGSGSESSAKKPNPRLNESLCPKNLSRSSRNAWFRRQLEEEVSAIPIDESDSLIRVRK